MPVLNVERRNFAWFALADTEQCRLFCCRLTRQATQCVEEQGSLKRSTHEREQKEETTEADAAHTIEDERRFADETAEWLNQRAVRHEMTRLIVYATPRMLGLLRRSAFYVTNGHLTEADSDFMGLKTDELADHQLIRDVIRARHSR